MNTEMALQQPFEVPFEQVSDNLEFFVDRVFEALESAFLVMPRGTGFVEADRFKHAYDALLAATDGFHDFDADRIIAAAQDEPLVLVALRSILGFTPPEWADTATLGTNEAIDQGFTRNLDRAIRKDPDRPIGTTSLQQRRVRALIQAACDLLRAGPGSVDADQIHRLDKVDTSRGIESIRRAASDGIPYADLLYERFLGRPFASRRDSVSELVGDILEFENPQSLGRRRGSVLSDWPRRKNPRFDQAPDFVAPAVMNAEVIIEAKMTQDDGTARDKVTRLQHLDRIRSDMESAGRTAFELVAAIGGRGFGVRRSDMAKLILATRGKVFTLANIEKLVSHTRLAALRHPT